MSNKKVYAGYTFDKKLVVVKAEIISSGSFLADTKKSSGIMFFSFNKATSIKEFVHSFDEKDAAIGEPVEDVDHFGVSMVHIYINNGGSIQLEPNGYPAGGVAFFRYGVVPSPDEILEGPDAAGCDPTVAHRDTIKFFNASLKGNLVKLSFRGIGNDYDEEYFTCMDEGQVIDDIVADKLERYQEILIEDEEEEF